MTNRYTEWDGAEQTNNRWSSKYTFIHQLRVVSRGLYYKQVERACVLDSHVDVWTERVYWRRVCVCECLRRRVTLKTSIHPRISEEGEGQTQVSEIIWIDSDSKSVEAVSISRLNTNNSETVRCFWASLWMRGRRRSTTLITDRSSQTSRAEPSTSRAEQMIGRGISASNGP